MILAIDLGTGSVKVAAIRDDGTTAGTAEATYAVDAPNPGWAETDPEAWWRAVCEACRALPDAHRREVDAIGFSGQMHSVVLCADDGTPARPAVLWSDARSEDVLPAYRRLSAERRQRLANPIVAGMTGPSLLWLARHEPASLERARWALQPKDWLRLRMTGVAATDPSDASATLLYDLEADGWAEDVVRALGLPPELLPPLRPSDAEGGTLVAAAAADLGLEPGLPVAVGAGDTPAAALGSDLVREGEAQLSLGTGAQIVVIGTGRPADAEPAVHRFRSALPSQRYTMAAMQNAGLALTWVRATLGMTWEELYAGFDPTALRPDLVFLPYLSGERTPLMDATARGAWVGLGLHHTRQDLATAALAGVALSVRDGFQAVRDAGLDVQRLRLTGGGSRDPRFRQFLCDLLGVPFELADTPRASAVGAARLAARMLGRDLPGSAAEDAERTNLHPQALGEMAQRLAHAYAGTRERLVAHDGPADHHG